MKKTTIMAATALTAAAMSGPSFAVSPGPTYDGPEFGGKGDRRGNARSMGPRVARSRRANRMARASRRRNRR